MIAFSICLLFGLLLYGVITVTTTVTVTNGSDSQQVQNTQQWAGWIAQSFSVAGATVNHLYGITFTQSKLKVVYISSDQAITIKTNSSGSPTDTLSIAAGGAVAWNTGLGGTCPFTGDVTGGFYISNAGATAANVQIRILWDNT